jgi:hypothetical protein
MATTHKIEQQHFFLEVDLLLHIKLKSVKAINRPKCYMETFMFFFPEI